MLRCDHFDARQVNSLHSRANLDVVAIQNGTIAAQGASAGEI